jgi:ABC-type Fe3+-hydroxamate transport system substrate-binding protein
LEILAGDTILNIEGTPEQAALRETFGDTNPLWARLPAVQSDRVFPVDFNRFSGIYGVSGYLDLLDQFEQISSPS